MKKFNWKKIDATYKYAYRQDRLEMAKSLGFDYISECTAKLYQKHQSTNIVAKILKLSPAGVSLELDRLGIKKRGPGGKHKKQGGKRHHWNPLMTNTRAPFSREG